MKTEDIRHVCDMRSIFGSDKFSIEKAKDEMRVAFLQISKEQLHFGYKPKDCPIEFNVVLPSLHVHDNGKTYIGYSHKFLRIT